MVSVVVIIKVACSHSPPEAAHYRFSTSINQSRLKASTCTRSDFWAEAVNY